MKKINWKLSFYLLLGAIVLILTLFAIFIFSTPPISEPLPNPIFIDEPGAEFKVEATKDDLNELINDYLDQVLLADSADFSVYIDQNILLYGSWTVFGASIPITIEMDPVVQANGDLVLSISEMSLGLLNLPRDRILHYLNRQIATPDWLYFDSENEQIYVAVTQIDIQSNFRFSVQELDLSDDSIAFLIKIPRAGAIVNQEEVVE